MAEENPYLAPSGTESIIPSSSFPYSVLGSTFAIASGGDICEMQLYSCRKQRLTVFANMPLPDPLGAAVRPDITTLSQATDAIAWLTAIRNIGTSIQPFFNARQVTSPRLYASYFTYQRGGRRYATTQEIAQASAAVCGCIENAKGVKNGAVSYTSTRDEL
jgi:hypothetical protein